MQTTSILNPLITANATPSPAQSNRGADQTQPAQPFQKVLSREMADRTKPAAGDATRPAHHTGPESAKAPQKTASRDKPAKSEGARESDKEDESDTTSGANDAATAAAAASDMLALVANIAPVVAPAAAAEASAETEAADITIAVANGDELLADPASARTGRRDAAATEPATKFSAAMDLAGKAALDTHSLSQGAGLKANLDTELKADFKLDGNSDLKHATDTSTAGDKAEALVTETALNIDKTAPEAKPADDILAKGQALMRVQKDEAELPKAVKEPVQNILQAAHQPSAHAALQAVNNAAVRADHLAPRVGSNGWDQALGQKITWMVAGEQQTASLTLNPPDLGPLQVVLSVSNSQASATFTAAQPEVRQALEAALPKLRDMLGESGIQLGQATVNSGDPQQQQGQFERRASESSSRQRNVDNQSSTEASVRTARVSPAGLGRGLVDTFV